MTQPEPVTVCVLITCHNRRETTKRCLRTVAAQEGLGDVQVRVFLVDDGSTDGTAEMVRAEFPEVTVLQGSGDLYWTGGMAMAEDAAWETRPDFLMWLNDDVVLFPGAVRELVDTALETSRRAVVVGSLHGTDSREQTYGGFRVPDLKSPFQHHRVAPNGTVQQVDTMHGNVVLVPHAVREVVGGVDTRFPHNMADTDYGYRTRRAGFDVVLCRGYLGMCDRDPARQRWRQKDVPLRTRWRLVVSKKVFPPRARWTFVRQYCGWKAFPQFLSPYADALWPGRRVKLRLRRHWTGKGGGESLFAGDDSLFKELARKCTVYGEYGPGTSTAWVLANTTARVLSVETNEEWARQVRKIRASSERLRVHSVDIGEIVGWGWPATNAHSDRFPEYVDWMWYQDESPDLVLIDGRFRVASWATTFLRARPGTAVLFDDYADRPQYKVVEEVAPPIKMCGRQAMFRVPESIDKEACAALRERFMTEAD